MSRLQELIDTVSFLTGKPRKAVELVTVDPEKALEADSSAASSDDAAANELPGKKAPY